MSHVEHQAMCVTSQRLVELMQCRDKIIGVFPGHTSFTTEIFNTPFGYATFFVIPCGSKAGWPEEKKHLEAIEKAKEIIKSFDYEDGSNPIKYTVAIYGEHEG